MELKKVSVRGVSSEAWDTLRRVREIEQRMLGSILSDAIIEFWDYHYEDE